MAYIGQGLPADVFAGFTVDKFTGTGVASQTLTLTKAPLGETALLVTIDGVVQEPTDDFTVSGTTVTLVGTAANGSEINVTHLSGTVPNTLASAVDVNGLSDGIILDADGDSTISADTDDQIDFKVGGTDQIKLTDGVLAPTTTNDVDLGSTSLRFKDVAISNDIVHLDNAGTGRTLYDRSENLLGNAGTNFYGYSIYLGGTGNANRLEDYEEGTFTAGWTASTAAPSGVNYAANTGFYVKVGNHVFLNLYLALSSWTSAGTGNARITGLPFSATSTTNFYAAINVGYSNAFGNAPVGGLLSVGNNYIDLFKISSADSRSNMNSYLQLTSPDMSGDESIVISVMYQTDS